jgi:FAD/FMN-containing dehydrogenase
LSALLDDLACALDPAGLITDAAALAGFATDILGRSGVPPLALARPSSAEEVARVVRIAGAHATPIVPVGGRTGFCGGVLMPGGAPALALSLERLRRIRAIDPLGNTITVEAGVPLAAVQEAARNAGRSFPLSHGGEGSSQIGGNLSTCAGGNNAIRYGTAREQALGLEVVLPDGTTWDGLRRLRKNTAGYDLKQLFIGAEGTLGIVTAAVLRLRPGATPETAAVALAAPQAALALLRRLEGEFGEMISTFELMSDGAVAAALTVEGTRLPFATRPPWLALIEIDAPSPRLGVRSVFETVLATVLDEGRAANAVICQSELQRASLWRLREAIAVALVADRSCLKVDTAVPVSAVPDFIAAAGAAVERAIPGCRPVPFGHLGDGNIHFNVRRPEHMGDDRFRAAWPELLRVIEDISLSLGGTISAEHGIGRVKRERLVEALSPVELDLMRRLKAALDPAGLLNPGAVLSSDRG